jgi:hypothetical protein
MPNFKVNIFELTRQVFKIDGYIPTINGIRPEEFEYADEIPTIELADSIGNSVLGTAVFETLAFRINDELIEFEDAPLIDVTLSKHIIKSKIANRNGTVKEWIAEGDYMVRVRGLMANHDGEDLPYDKIERLHKVVKLNEAIKVESTLLNRMGIFNLVITKAFYPANEQLSNIQPYVLECISDEPIELELNV